MITTTTAPDVPLPAGAERFDDWQPHTPMAYRVVASPNRVVQGPPEGILVWTNAVQWLDGSVDDGRLGASPRRKGPGRENMPGPL
jgi:hypothetical protein